MKKRLRNSLLVLVIGVLIHLPFLGFSQPGDPPDPDVPIDGGISFLIAGGAAFGIKKVFDINKKKK